MLFFLTPHSSPTPHSNIDLPQLTMELYPYKLMQNENIGTS